MKRLEKLSIILIIVFSIIMIMYSKVFAMNISDIIVDTGYTDEYNDYLNLSEEERSKIIQPRSYEVINTGRTSRNPLYLAKLYGGTIEKNYSLKDVIPNNVIVKDQRNTSICWAFAALASLETNLAITKDASKTYDFSEKHMDYSTSTSFKDGLTNPFGFNRIAGSGGNFSIAQAYLTNGSGAIDESEMQFDANVNPIDISEIQNKTVTSQVYDTVIFPSYDVSGDTSEIETKIKNHIKTYGAIVASIYSETEESGIDTLQYINITTGAMYCNDDSKTINHQLVIIGWDDEYPIDKFNPANRPTRKGAWIVKNSWGDQVGDNGIMYISYQDANVYKYISGITKSDNSIDYENIYQYAPYGSYGYSTINTNKVELANVFNKKTDGKEYITQVSIELLETATCKVYVNAKGTDKTKKSLQMIQLRSGDSETLEPGYHTLEFAKPVEIQSDNFVVVVEIEGKREGVIVIPLEMNSDDEVDSIYSGITIENGKCFFSGSLESGEWFDLSQLPIDGGKTKGADNTIKVFTVSHINDDSLNHIQITTPPDKTSYFEGEDFDKTGMVVTAYYNNEKSSIVDNYTIVNGENLKRGQNSVIISFEGATATQEITVSQNTVESLIIKQPPLQTEYMEGHDFDAEGMVVEATFKDGSVKEVTDYTIINGDNLKSTQTYVTISYGNKQVNQEITVEENAIESIKIKTPPTKVKYFEGEDFDKTGMVVIATYEDGYERQVLDYTIENETNLQRDQYYVTIKYADKSVEQSINVVQRPLNSNFDNSKAKVTKMDYYIFSDSNKEDYVTLNIEVSDVIINSGNENLEYYYYLSENSNESNITKWNKAEHVAVGADRIDFIVDSRELPNYEEIFDAEQIYLYIKEVAISNDSESVLVSKGMKLEAEDGTDIQVNIDDHKVEDTKIPAVSGKYDGSTTTGGSTGATSGTSDKTVTSSTKLPKTGVTISILFCIMIVSVIGMVGYIKYKKLNKYIK